MRKSCVKPVEIAHSGRGNEHILCTIPAGTNQPMGTKPVVFTQQIRAQSAHFPQAKKNTPSLFYCLFSPQSTTTINTITIHIN